MFAKHNGQWEKERKKGRKQDSGKKYTQMG